MRKYILLSALILLGLSACNKKGKTSSVSLETSRPVVTTRPVASTDEPAFVTDRSAIDELMAALESQPAQTESEADLRASTPVEMIEPLTFAPRETEHVRIVEYDPFCGASEMVLDLDELGRYFCYPYGGNRTSDYGMRGRSMHTGVDIKAIPNDTIRAALGGVVRMSKVYSGYGNIVVIRHPCGLETAYAHNSRNLVQPNDVVRAGQAIALAGRTGRATTEHLHFETRVMGEHFNPNLFLDTQNRCIRGGKIRLVRQNGRIAASNAAYGGSSARNMASARNTTAPSSSAVAASVPEAHTVQRGDTLYSVSRRYGLTVNRLCDLNGISSESILSIGQRLKLK